MMYLFVACLLTASHFTIGAVAPSPNCDVCINQVCHRRIPVLTHYEQIGQIAIDRNSNIFYFFIKDINNKNKRFTCAYDLDNVDLHRIWAVDFSFARAVDQVTRDVYVSTENNVYKTNPARNFSEGETVFEGLVWQMQFKDKLYYIDFNAKGIKIFENNQHREVEGLSKYKIDEFIIDKTNDIYFINDFAVYKLENGEKEATLFADEIYSLTTDKSGEAYFIQPYTKGIYKIDYNTNKLVEIGAFSDGTPYQAVFTSDNSMIYSDIGRNGMYLLQPNDGPICSVVEHSSHGKNAMKTVSTRPSRK